MKVISVFGTRPEAVKMCPLVRELAGREGIESRVCLSSQHRELLYGVTELFGVRADYDLALMRERQSLNELFCGVLRGMGDSVFPLIFLIIAIPVLGALIALAVVLAVKSKKQGDAGKATQQSEQSSNTEDIPSSDDIYSESDKNS